jgi:hypothetical protein
MKQGKASISGPYDQKVEPNAKAVNPGAVSYLGNKQGNHTTESGDFTPNLTPWSDGRGYMAPSIGQKRHKSGSQGEY